MRAYSVENTRMPSRPHFKTRTLFSVAAEMFAIFGPLRYGKSIVLRFIHALPQPGVFQQNRLKAAVRCDANRQPQCGQALNRSAIGASSVWNAECSSENPLSTEAKSPRPTAHTQHLKPRNKSRFNATPATSAPIAERFSAWSRSSHSLQGAPSGAIDETCARAGLDVIGVE